MTREGDSRPTNGLLHKEGRLKFAPAPGEGRGASLVLALGAVALSAATGALIVVLGATGVALFLGCAAGAGVLLLLRLPATWILSAVVAVHIVHIAVGSGPIVTSPANIYLSDFFVAFGVLHWFVNRRGRLEESRSYWLWVGVLAAGMLPGLIHGYVDGHVSLFSNHVRFLFFSLIAFAFVGYRLSAFLRPLQGGLYGATMIAAGTGLILFASGETQTAASILDTGGARALAASVAMYTAMGTVLVAVVWAVRRRLSTTGAIVLGAGAVVQILALGRTTLAVLVAVLAAVFLFSSHLRRVGAAMVGFGLPVLVVLALSGAVAAPAPLQVFTERITNTSASEGSAQWRVTAIGTIMRGWGASPIVGLGFGREPTFTQSRATFVVDAGDPHSGFVYLLAGGGLLALMGFVGLLGAATVTAARSLARSRLDEDSRIVLAWALGSLVIYAFNILTSPMLTQPWNSLTIWALMAVILVCRAPRAPAAALASAQGANTAHGGANERGDLITR